jgi:hypothetical protein
MQINSRDKVEVYLSLKIFLNNHGCVYSQLRYGRCKHVFIDDDELELNMFTQIVQMLFMFTYGTRTLRLPRAKRTPCL